ncbi:YlaN family protein [Ureibacillus composti]|uniref:UPF0358 protein EBB45_08910 n=1 Tax=Lysinibacillus composti TaxID=720633 RepID=A0A3N9UG08_9BACI|nr:YlaN family protein [Lysinibacillus composti]MBM7608228.1 uncharacterized protein YlaN (UPF0358 family) [Lysinibacillus composti]MDM5332598.1 YlaN family protein [Ureibacillus composti]RQW75084.1 DUF1507 family protein [Lysinibacillus composti]
MDTKSPASFQEKAVELLLSDADKIARLIRVQMDHLTMPQCPLYEEVLDTQMFGLSREIDFAVKLGLIEREQGKSILDTLEKELSLLHEAYTNR